MLAKKLGILAALFALPAEAAPTGGMFAGPVRPNGSSGYYNPSALGRANGPVTLFAETGLIFGEANYLRAGTSPFDNQPFSEVGFAVAAPTLDVSAVFATPWPWLSWGLAAFSPSASAASWPDEGPQVQHGSDALFLAYTMITGPVIRFKNFGFAALVGPTYSVANLRYGFDFGTYANDLAGADLFVREDPNLLGFVDATTQGWSMAASFGGWVQPLDWFRLGVGFLWLQDPALSGDLVVATPPVFDETFPNQEFRVRSKVDFEYKLPWVLSIEAEADFDKFTFAFFINTKTNPSGT